MQNIHVSTEPGGILLLTFTGEIVDAADVNSLRHDIAVVSQSIKDLHKDQGQGIKVLIDLTHFTANYISEGIDALAELAKQDEAFVQKTATFGGSVKIRAMGETIAALSGRKNIQFFENKFQAMEWLSKGI